ncbi:MAG: NAD-dependent epimerase/dehydratase family protein [Flavobacteriia bacterium]|nr:NAD-dependent epimerase/dehydratase family protein [Flavobacteriia bacterium]
MKVLVTGGAGFIGSHLVVRLVELGHEVVVLDNLLRGNKLPESVLESIEFHLGDVRDAAQVNACMHGVDTVYHFAAVLGVDVVADHPVETMDVEVIGTRNVVNAALEQGVKQLFYASTSGIYSHSAIVKTALSEDVLVDPRTSYAMAKRYNEIYLASHFEETGLNTIALRFFNVYGERQDNRMVIPRFIEQAIENSPLTVFGNGQQTRDFTYIDDVIEACIRLQTIVWDTSSEINYIDAPKKRYDYEVERRIGSSSKLFQLTGFKPETDLKTGLSQLQKIKNPEIHGQ